VSDPRVAPRAAGFGEIADRYERARPLYPDAALSELAAQCRFRPGTLVADLGAGTGKLTRQLVALGADVVAIEPAAGMRRRLQEEVPGVKVLDGTAEDIPLPDASVDVVAAGQAFHWFDTRPALDEIARVLRPAGWLALLRNERPQSGWAAELWDLRTELTGGTRVYPGDGWTEVLAGDERFGSRTSSRHDVVVTTTVDAELADSASRSCVYVVDDAERAEVLRRLRWFLATHYETAGRDRLTYTRPCTLHLCQRAR
jgi:SAM-dependent methyltransferase